MKESPIYNNFNGISDIRNALQNRKISAVELAISALDNVETFNELNCFLHVDKQFTLSEARKVDIAIANGTAGPLAGVPIAHKDTIVTRNWYTTAGSKMLQGYLSPFDATVVERLNQAGAVSLGKLNCDEFAMGSSNENSAYGSVKNPWDNKAIPGGSSGGSAAAVAARIIYAATGTDTGGSIRLPASMCGISGIKPTYGVVSRFGIVAFGSSLDQAGPLAHSSYDLLELLDVMSGFDPRDPTSLEYCNNVRNETGRIRAEFNYNKMNFKTFNKKPLSGIRIGVPKEYFDENLAADVACKIENALIKLEKLGSKIIKVSLPHTQFVVPTYYVIAPAEAASNLARYDGIRYGYRTQCYSSVEDMISKSRSEGFGEEVKRRILMGTYVLSHKNYTSYYLQAQRLRTLISEDFQKVFSNQCDIIIGPVVRSVDRNLNQKNEDPTLDWLNDIYTLGSNLSGLPAMSIPCGFSKLYQYPRPIGLQIVGNYFMEGFLLAIADCYQSVTDWHRYYVTK